MSPSTPTATVPLLWNEVLKARGGHVVPCERRPRALLEALVARRLERQPDAWFLPGTFCENRRTAAAWESSWGITLDFDYEDPEVPAAEGPHQTMPEAYRARLLAALEDYSLPAVAYPTRRGMRLVHVLTADVHDLDDYATLTEAAGDRFLRHLESRGVGTWRKGVPGLRLDPSSTQPYQAQRLPLPYMPVLPLGADRPVDRTELLNDTLPRLDLDAALPSELAEVCRRIGAGFQIAPEVAVANLMASASGLIGNTRAAAYRGTSSPLSLHYITIQGSGAGKSTVRKFLRQALERPLKAIYARRAKALEEAAEYQEELRRWKKSGNDGTGPPSPPPRSPLGGTRASLLVTGTTLEGLVDTLIDTPRGVLWSCDEAHQLIGILGRYSESGGGRSLDAARLRSLMESEFEETQRAGSNVIPTRTLRVPFLAIEADVQPGLVARLFSSEDLVSGMTSRFLMHEPPSLRGRRRYVDPPPAPGGDELEVLRRFLEPLWDLELDIVDGSPHPVLLDMSPDAERLYAVELERMEVRYVGISEAMAGTLGHARGRLVRLAGVLALLRDCQTLKITELDVRRAIHHIRYHLAHMERLFSRPDEWGEHDRLQRLDQSALKILAKQPKRGVTPRDLQLSVSKSRYRGTVGRQQAVADLNALGWTPKRPPSRGGGRPPQPGWFPPGVSPGARREEPTPGEGDSVGSVGTSPRPQATREDARELLAEASEVLLSRGEVELPPPGLRTPCPICGSSDGLGRVPHEHGRWHCFSSKHDAGGCAVDLHLGARLGRQPSAAEAVAEAKHILGELDHR